MAYDTIRKAIKDTLKNLDAEHKRLTAILDQLGDDIPPLKLPKFAPLDLSLPKTATKKKAKRIKLTKDTRASITEKIVKAAKAHGKTGASKADIIQYLKTNGYEVGHHFNLPHMFDILSLLRGKGGRITTTGEKAAMRYHAA